jgi:hypothetical protein
MVLQGKWATFCAVSQVRILIRPIIYNGDYSHKFVAEEIDLYDDNYTLEYDPTLNDIKRQ